jgi:hypothetical protein
MNYRLLGNSGLRVSEVALGTMTFGTDWGWGADRDEARRILKYSATRAATSLIPHRQLIGRPPALSIVNPYAPVLARHFLLT